MARITRAAAEQKARDFVATFESKQACWDYLDSLGVFWGKNDDTATNDEKAMEMLIGEYLYGLDPSLAKTTGHYISKARRRERFTSHADDLKFFDTKDELEQMARERGEKIIWYNTERQNS